MRFSRVLLITLLGAVACSSPGLPETRPPNIVFIVADDLVWTDLGSYGSGFHETPNIDSLAREGTRFTNAYANPNCAPTRAALMTGRYSPRTGVYTVASGGRGIEEFRRMIPVENVTDLPLAEVTFAELFQSAGYVTAHMGKWHLGTDAFAPTGQGFDLNLGGNQTGGPMGGYFSPYQNLQLPDGPEGEHLTGRLAAEAVSFIESNRDRPFLLYLPFYAVHSPIQARRRRDHRSGTGLLPAHGGCLDHPDVAFRPSGGAEGSVSESSQGWVELSGHEGWEGPQGRDRRD